MMLSSKTRKQGQRGGSPFPLHPQSPPNLLRLRFGPSRLTIPNTCSTITVSASLRSDCCSPSFRNAVRLPSGIDVYLHRNAQSWVDVRQVQSVDPTMIKTIQIRGKIAGKIRRWRSSRTES